CRERRQGRPGRIRNSEGPCRGRRIPPCPAQGGLCPRDRDGAEGDRPRLRHPHALHGRAFLRHRQARTAETTAPRLYGNPLRVQYLITPARRNLLTNLSIQEEE